MPKIVGILGGMGPLSTVELMKKVIKKTPVDKEQDHIRMLVDNRPEIPDRTDFILGKGPSPIPMLQESAQQLEKWGAQFIAMPCNSAHAFIEQIQEAVKIQILDVIDLIEQELGNNFITKTNIGLLATTGTIYTKLYHNYLSQFSIITPDSKVQEEIVMEAIYGKDGFKKNGATEGCKQKLLKAIAAMKSNKLQAIIAGCTEVELILKTIAIELPVFYPLDILSKEIVRVAST